MLKGAVGLDRELSRTARGYPRAAARAVLLILPVLLLLAPCARGDEVDSRFLASPDENRAGLTWRDALLEWGAGTALGTGAGMLRAYPQYYQIPQAGPYLAFAIGIANCAAGIAVSTPFSCAAGCGAAGLALQSDGVLWHGFEVGTIVAIVGTPLGTLAYHRTGSSILGSFVPAALGSAGAVIGYNYELLFAGDNEAEIPSVGSLDPQFRWQSFRAEAPCGIALGAAGGLILPRWLHGRPDSTGQPPPGFMTADRVMDILLIYPLPCLLGIDGCALAMGREYDFWSGYFGAALGTAAVIGVGALAGYGKQLDANPLARLLPAVAAGVFGTIGFNAIDFEGDFLTGQQRFHGPALAYAGPDYKSGGAGINLDLRLLTVRF